VIWKQPCDAGVAIAAPSAPATAGARPWILAATILGSSLAFIDGTVVNVALPALQRDLAATAVDVQWVVEAYSLLLSALLLVGGALGDRLGRRRVYAAGIVVFSLASAACGLASSVGALVGARAVQGAGAALLVPGSLALIGASFPARERGAAIGTWSSASAVTAALGPVAGGWLIEHLSWRWAFFLNLPLAAVVLVLLFWRVPESSNPDAGGRLDWPGATLATAGLSGLVYGLLESSRLGWHDASVLAALAAGAVALVAFGVVEARGRAPMVPPALFRSRTFTGANVLTFFLYGALAALFFFLPLVLIQVHTYSATAAGAATLPFIAVMSVLSPWAGGLVDRVGARRPLVVGPLVAATAFALFALPESAHPYWRTILPPMVVLGLGMAITVAPLTTTVMNAVDVRHVGIASGINNATSRTAGLLAIAAVSGFVLHVFDGQLGRRLAEARLPPAVEAAVRAERVKLGAIEPPSAATPAERAAIRQTVRASFVAAFRALAVVTALLAMAASATAAVTIDGPPPRAALRPARST